MDYCLHFKPFVEKIKSQQNLIDEFRESSQTLSKQQLDRELELKRRDNSLKELEETNIDLRERLNRRSEECDR